MDNKVGLINFLESFLTNERKEVIDRVLDFRTKYLTVVLENIYQPHNASAVLRSCDCFGVQDVHIIENTNTYDINPHVVVGSSKWLNLNKYNETNENTLATINGLRKKGYRIVATTPHTNDVTLNDFEIEKGPVALMFGTEHTGLSDIALENADEFLKIPMFGFTESYNISVSAALILNTLTQKMHNSNTNWQLTSDDSNNLKLNWLIKTIKKPKLLIEEYCKQNNLNIDMFIDLSSI